MYQESLQSKIARMKRELKLLEAQERGEQLKQPEFENDYFFVEDGVFGIKCRPGQPRRKLYTSSHDGSSRVETAHCYNMKMDKSNAEEVRRFFNNAMDFYIKEVK